MIERLGYACVVRGIEAMTSRTCRLANATPERLRALIADNLAGLAAILRYNLEKEIRLFRISSGLIPFGSLPVNAVPWWDEFAAELSELGAYARAHAMRLTMHPGQFTVLASPNPAVVQAAVDELVYHARVLDALGLETECKLTIHGGGTYGDKAAAIERFRQVYLTLPEPVVRRLVVENDERSYSAADVLDIHAGTGIPVIFDALHDQVNPSPGFSDRADLLVACFATWRGADGRPLSHFSSQDPTKRPGAHAEWLDPRDFLAFDRDTGPVPVDCMLEAKGKDLALLRLRQALSTASVRFAPTVG